MPSLFQGAEGRSGRPGAGPLPAAAEGVKRKAAWRANGSATRHFSEATALHHAVIAATGLYTPPQSVSNAELVAAFNAYVETFNAKIA